MLLPVSSMVSAGRANPEDGYTWKVLRNDLDEEVRLRLEIRELNVEYVELDGERFAVLEIPGAGQRIRLGEPMAPLVSAPIQICDDCEVQATVRPLAQQEFQLEAPLLPGQEAEVADIKELRWREPLRQVSLEAYPESLVQVGEPEILRDVRVVQLTVYPVRYSAANRQVELLRSVEISIRPRGPSARNVISGVKPPIPPTWGDLYAAVIPNYDTNATDRGIEEHILVVVRQEAAYRLEEWQSWKEQEGYVVDVITIGAGATADQIRSQILTYYQSLNRPTYVMLVGRESEVPVSWSSYNYWWNGDYWSGSYVDESFYSRLDGTDFLPDVFLTRLPGNVSVSTMLSRALYWERTPNMAEDCYSTALMSCSGLYQSQQTVKEQVAERLYRVHDFDMVYEFYDWTYSTRNQIMNRIDQGVSIINYRGEGWTSGWNPGHSYTFHTTDVANLNNVNKPLIITSIGCGVCRFTDGLCFGESWMRLGNSQTIKGAVAICGPTGNTHTTFNNWLDRGIYRGLAYDNLSVLSQAYLAGKIYMRDRYPEYTEIVRMLFGLYIQFGTPDTRYRTILPEPPAWGFAFSPTNMGRYIALRTAENWRGVAAKVVVQLPGQPRDVLTLDSKGAGRLELPPGTTSVPVHISGYNIRPFQAELDLTGERGRLLITEVKPDIETTGEQGDMVELFNADNVPIDLRNMILTDLDLYDIPFVTQSAVLQPGELAVIHFLGGKGTEEIIPRPYGLEIRSRAYPDFSSREDQCVLRDAEGHILDALAWHDGDGQPATRNDYRDLSRFTPPTSRLAVEPDGWWYAPDDVAAEEYELYTIDWSAFAGAGGPGSIQRVVYGDHDDPDSFIVAEITTWGEHSAPPYTTTPIPPTATPAPSPTQTPLPSETPTPGPTATPAPPTATPPGTSTPHGESPTPTPDFSTTPAPSPTEPPAPTPTPQISISLYMPQHTFRPGAVCWLDAVTHNSGPAIPNVWLVVFLDIGTGDYWFWPGWVHYPPAFDAQSIDLETGDQIFEIIPPFIWPAGVGSLDGLRFWGAITDFQLIRLLGEMAEYEFSYAE
jgi:hypothetical protein